MTRLSLRAPARYTPVLLLLWGLLLFVLAGCTDGEGGRIVFPQNHPPVLDSLVAMPDTIGPSDSTVVACYARDADGDTLVFDWKTDARLNIQGTSTSNRQLNAQLSPQHTFYNANLPNPINDSAWVYCLVRDRRGGGAAREVFIVLSR